MAQQAPTTTNADNPKLAIAAALFAMLSFSFGDALVKYVSADLSLWQILVLRSVLTIPVLIVICRIRPKPLPIWPTNVFWTVLRSSLMILMWLFYYVALLVLPMSVAASVYYTMPIIVALISATIIRDKIGTGGWSGVAIGFLGVLLIVRPDSSGFNLFTLFPAGAALCFAIVAIITRNKIRDEHPYVLTLNLHLAFLLTGVVATVFIYSFGDVAVGPFFGGPWKSVGVHECIVIVVLALSVTLGNLGTSLAYQIGESSMIATISFSYIPFATLWGLLLFSEFPDSITIAGIVLIIVAGSLAVRK